MEIETSMSQLLWVAMASTVHRDTSLAICSIVIDALDLQVALGYKSGLVLLDFTVSVAFDLEDPFAAYDIHTIWAFD